jgi:hypothetical protein
MLSHSAIYIFVCFGAVIFSVYTYCSYLVGKMSERNGYLFFAGFWLSMASGPLIGYAVMTFLERRTGGMAQLKCPNCGAAMSVTDRACPGCGLEI